MQNVSNKSAECNWKRNCPVYYVCCCFLHYVQCMYSNWKPLGKNKATHDHYSRPIVSERRIILCHLVKYQIDTCPMSTIVFEYFLFGFRTRFEKAVKWIRLLFKQKVGRSSVTLRSSWQTCQKIRGFIYSSLKRESLLVFFALVNNWNLSSVRTDLKWSFDKIGERFAMIGPVIILSSKVLFSRRGYEDRSWVKDVGHRVKVVVDQDLITGERKQAIICFSSPRSLP